MSAQRPKRADLIGAREALPAEFATAIDRFERHLRLEATRSPHTVRAYLGDVVGYLDHLAKLGGTRPGDMTLANLRGWLAISRGAGQARTTLARRSAALRTFTAWAPARATRPQRSGSAARQPPGTPEPARSPARGRGRSGDEHGGRRRARNADVQDADPTHTAVAQRDHLIVELLYATGIRVSELCGLDVDDIDRTRRVLRVLGKGAKERTVPYGTAAERALDAGCRTAGRCLPVPAAARRCCSAHAADGSTSALCGASSTLASAPWPGRRTSARTGCGTPRRPTCSTGAPTCARCRNCSVTPAWRPPRSTRTSRSNGSARPTRRPIHARDLTDRPESRARSILDVIGLDVTGLDVTGLDVTGCWTSLSWTSLCDRHEVDHPERLEQQQRIEVLRAAARPPMQAAPRTAAGMGAGDDAEGLARAHRWPPRTAGTTGSYSVRTPSPCITTTTPRPATVPAKDTVPRAGARTVSPVSVARSTPRCPGAYGAGRRIEAAHHPERTRHRGPVGPRVRHGRGGNSGRRSEPVAPRRGGTGDQREGAQHGPHHRRHRPVGPDHSGHPPSLAEEESPGASGRRPVDGACRRPRTVWTRVAPIHAA